MTQRRAGIIQLQIQGEIYDAKGSFSYNLGREKRESIVGADRIHGFKAMPQPAFVEGEITDRVTLQLANGKVIVLRDAFFAGEGTGNTEEANIAVRFEGASAEEVR
jgi:hypothetical protein